VQASGGVLPWGVQGFLKVMEYLTMQALINPHANQQTENVLESFQIGFKFSEIQLSEIKNIKRFQVREVLDAVGAHEGIFSKKIVDEYTESLKRGDKFPAIVVRQNDHGYDIVEGRHRYRANKNINSNVIWAYVLPGHISDQICRTLACVLNDIHGHANSEGDRKKVSLENATQACLKEFETSKRDQKVIIAEIAKSFGVNDSTLKVRIKAKQAKAKILEVGENPNLISDTIAGQMKEFLFESSPEEAKKLTQAVVHSRDNGLSSDRIHLTIREARDRGRTPDQLTKELQVEGNLDEQNRKLRVGEAEIIRRSDSLIANIEAAKSCLKKDVSSFVLSYEKQQQLLLCLKEVKNLASDWCGKLEN
jgi:hypothetical protein